jgi:hypothetical protein
MRYTLLLLVLSYSPLSAQRDTLFGDLTADGQPEMVILERFATAHHGSEEDVDTLASTTVYRLTNGTWRPWAAATGALLHAYDEAGMERLYVSIERGALVLTHYHPGASTNWQTTRRFRWQNNQLELIGLTHGFFDRCSATSSFDYNLSSGRYHFTEETQECDDNWEDVNHQVATNIKGRFKQARAITLQNSDHLVVRVKIPGYGEISF